MRKLFYLSGKTLSRQRIRAAARKNESGASGDKEVGKDPREGLERAENDL